MFITDLFLGRCVSCCCPRGRANRLGADSDDKEAIASRLCSSRVETSSNVEDAEGSREKQMQDALQQQSVFSHPRV